MNKFLTKILLYVILINILSPIGQYVYANENREIYINDTKVDSGIEIINDAPYIKIADISDVLNFNLNWNNEEKTLSINDEVIFFVDKKEVINKNELLLIEYPLIIKNSKAMIELNTLCNVFNYSIIYDESKLQYNINTASTKMTLMASYSKIFSGKVNFPSGKSVANSNGFYANVNVSSTRGYTYYNIPIDQVTQQIFMSEGESTKDFSITKTNCFSTDEFKIGVTNTDLGDWYISDNGMTNDINHAKTFPYNTKTADVSIDIPVMWDVNYPYYVKDGYTYTLYNRPIYLGTELFVDVSSLGDFLGYYIRYDSYQRLTFSKLGNTIVTEAYSNTATVNGAIKQLPSKSFFYNSAIMMPLSSLCDIFNFSYYIDENRKVIYIHEFDYELYLNNQLYDSQLCITDNKVLSPLKPIAGGLLASVVWDDNTDSIIISKNGTTINLKLDNLNYTVNGISKVFSCEPRYIDQIIYVPLKEIAENLGYNYDVKDFIVNIYEGLKPIIPPSITVNYDTYVKNVTNADIVAVLQNNNHTFLNITNGDKILDDNAYLLHNNFIIFKKEYIESLPTGINNFVINFESDVKLNTHIIVKEVYNETASNYLLYLDNRESYMYSPFLTVNNQFYISLSNLKRIFDVSVSLNVGLQEVTLENTYKKVVFNLYSYTYTSNGETKYLRTPPITNNSEAFLPIKVVADEFGYDYQRDIVNNKIDITTPNIYIDSIWGNSLETFFDSNGNTSLSIYSKESASVKLCMAFYNEESELLNCAYFTKDLYNGYNSVYLNISQYIDINSVDKVKLMILNTSNNLQPHFKALEIKKQAR